MTVTPIRPGFGAGTSFEVEALPSISESPAQAAKRLGEEARERSEEVARLALAAALEGALQLQEVADDRIARSLKPSAVDAMKRLGELIARQVTIIEGMI